MLKIEYLEKEIPVYDITVEDNHNFFANGILVHNCSEIILPTNKDRTAVCCLSSLNLEKYDEWKNDELFIKDVCEFLDNVLQYFIDNAPDTISRARYSASQERSIGVGALGFHAYLQMNNIPFESAIAKSTNMNMFRLINKRIEKANLELGAERGEAPDAIGTGRRFSNTMAIAPNASTSIIMGNTSPSVEPYKANAYLQDTLSGSHITKNRFLDIILKKLCSENKQLNYDELWSSIVSSKGSVQHLDCLDQHTKDVFKTAMELDQRWIIEHTADRQTYIDQSQSINLFFEPTVNIKYLHAVHFLAWKQGLKTLYYCRSEKILQGAKVSQKIERRRIEDEIDIKSLVNEEECLACQ